MYSIEESLRLQDMIDETREINRDTLTLEGQNNLSQLIINLSEQVKRQTELINQQIQNN